MNSPPKFVFPALPWFACFATVLLLAPTKLKASSLFIDCGSSTPSGGSTVNNLTSGALDNSLTALKDDTGATTSIALTITDSFHSLNSLSNGFTSVTGAAATAGFTGAMAQDYLLLNNLEIDGETNPQATVRFSGLVAGQSYTLTILSSRDDVIGTRFLDATLAGATSVAGSVDATANNSAVIVLTTTATPEGTLDCNFIARSGSNAAPVNALKLSVTSASDVPVASLVSGSGAPRVGGMLTGAYQYSDSDGDAESGTTHRWELANDAAGTGVQTIAGATGTTYTLQTADAGKYLRYVVTPGAASGPTPGFTSPSVWNGPVMAAGTLSSFHVGNSFTRWGSVHQQVMNLTAAAGGSHASRAQLTDTQSLAYQWDNRFANSTVQEGVPSGPELATGTWDVLVVQPQSHEWMMDSVASFTTYAQNFYNLADANGTRVYLYAYWNYLDELPLDFYQPMIDARFEQVRAAISTGAKPACVIPVGAAFKTVCDGITAGAITGITRNALYRDNLHPSDLGYYLSSLVHYATLRQKSPVGLPAQGINSDPDLNNSVAIDPYLAAKFQAIAWDTARFLGTSGVTAGRFATWAKDLPTGQQGFADTPFGDGVSNLARYAFGISKTGPDPGTGRFPQWATAPVGKLAVEYRLGTDAEDAGVITLQQWSNDLANWTQPPPQGLLTSRSGELVRLEFPTGSTPVFFRVLATLP